METIREIIEFSHDGYAQMWYPFSASLEENNTTISAEYYFEINDLLTLIRSMFTTNNHNPELVSKGNIKLSKEFLIGKTKKTVCAIRFKTDKSEYILQRCFIDQFSTEARLQKVGSTIIYHGENVIQMLSKISKPIIIDDRGMHTNSSLIFKPLDSFSRSCMASLANNWARMIGLVDSRIKLDFEGRWSSSSDVDSFANRRLSSRARMPSPLRLITNLAQAVMKKRTYGMSAPVFTPFNLETLNDFEAIAMMDLVRRVCKEESIQFIVGISSTNVNSMISAIETPRLSIYET